MYFDAEMYKNN